MGNRSLNKEPMVMVQCYVSVEMMAFIVKEAEQRHVSRAQVIRELLEKGQARR